jgi:O-antigen ligase
LLPVAGVILSVGGIAALSPWFWQRLTNSASVISRWEVWLATLRLWGREPWFGVGPGGFFWRYPAMLMGYSGEPNLLHPHNVWLEAGVTWGIAGFAWLLVLLVCTVRLASQRIDNPLLQRSAIGLLAGLAAGFAHAQVDAFFALPDLAAWNWVALGLLVQMKRARSGDGAR